MFDIESAKKLVRDWPITVERYDSGQLGFCARPMINGRRFNRSFSTSKWGTLQEAANAAIAYCQEIEQRHQYSPNTVRSPISTHALAQYEAIHNEAAKHGIDPIKAFRDGVQGHLKERAKELTLSQVVQHFLISLKNKGLKEGYQRDLKGFYSSFEQDFGGVIMAEITKRNADDWLNKRLNQKAIKSPVTWNTWRRNLELLWEFALLPENGWVAENVIEEIPKR
jgi:hypothetical protein